MAVTAFPIDADSGAPAYAAQDTRQAFSALMGIAPSGRPLGATSGVRPGTPADTVDLSGTTWTCGMHSGLLDAQLAANAGPYLYATDGTDTGTLTAADATNPRIDLLYVQVSDTVQDGSGLREGTIGYLAGTPASSPAAPTLPTRSYELARFNVPESGGGSPTVSFTAKPWGTRKPRGRIYVASNQTISDTNDTRVNFASTDYNIGSLVEISSKGFRVPDGWAGLYSLKAQLRWVGGVNGTERKFYARLNSSSTWLAFESLNSEQATFDAAATNHLNADVELAEGDLVDFYCWHNNGSGLNVTTNGGGSFVTLRWVDWPA